MAKQEENYKALLVSSLNKTRLWIFQTLVCSCTVTHASVIQRDVETIYRKLSLLQILLDRRVADITVVNRKPKFVSADWLSGNPPSGLIRNSWKFSYSRFISAAIKDESDVDADNWPRSLGPEKASLWENKLTWVWPLLNASMFFPDNSFLQH